MSTEEYNGHHYFGEDYFGVYFQTGAPIAQPQGPYFGPRFYGKRFYGHPYYGPGAIVPPPPPPPPPVPPATAGSVIGGGGGSGNFVHCEVRYAHPPLPPTVECTPLLPEPQPVLAPPTRRKVGRRLRPRHVAQPKRKASPLSWLIEAPDPEVQAAGAVLSVEEVEKHWVPKAREETLLKRLAKALEDQRAGESNVRKAERRAQRAVQRAEKRAARAERRAERALGAVRTVPVVVAPSPLVTIAWAGAGGTLGAVAGLMLLPERPAWLRPAAAISGALLGAWFGGRVS